MREVAEELRAKNGVPLWVHPEWDAAFPWLVQGTTGRGAAGEFDLGLAGETPVGRALSRWFELREGLGCAGIVVSRQVHGTVIETHGGAPAGLTVQRGADGHLTHAPGLTVAVTVADCVPVTLVDAERRRVAIVHAGWRGTAAGIVEAGVRRLVEQGGEGRVHAHLGPAICGACYEVGPEVHAALHPGRPAPPSACPVDLRAEQGERLGALGVPLRQTTRSSWCTLCGERNFFSHRAGEGGRQAGFAGVRGAP